MSIFILHNEEKLINEINKLSFFEEFIEDIEFTKYKEKIEFKIKSLNFGIQGYLKYSDPFMPICPVKQAIIRESLDLIFNINDSALDLIFPIQSILHNVAY